MLAVSRFVLRHKRARGSVLLEVLAAGGTASASLGRRCRQFACRARRAYQAEGQHILRGLYRNGRQATRGRRGDPSPACPRQPGGRQALGQASRRLPG